MLGRILNNLVSNALRYTPEGGVLVAARRRSGNQVRVDVWDTGIGIAAEHQARVFDEFYRVENHCDAAPGDGPRRGLGLGLSTVQRLAELIGSDVQLRSRPRRGSVFSFVLPEVAPQSHADLLVDMPLDVSGMRVLVVDDEPAILSGIRYLLRSWGCDVVTAEDGAQALDAVENWRTAPDLVISDLHLREGESGLEVLALLDAYYKSEGGRPFARLLITGETRRDRLQPILTANIPLLYKPVSPAQLRESMMAVWASIRDGT
jgi:CheY-like chemotaxis protein